MSKGGGLAINDLDRKTDKLYKECGLGWFIRMMRLCITLKTRRYRT
jgi:hypothetical protein